MKAVYQNFGLSLISDELPFVKEKEPVNLTRPIEVEGSRFKYIMQPNSAEQAVRLMYNISIPERGCTRPFKFMCPRSVYAYYITQLGYIIIYVQADRDPSRPLDTRVEAAVLPIESIHTTYKKTREGYILRRPTEVSEISFAEAGTAPREKSELGFADSGVYYFNPDFMEVPIDYGYTVYVYPKGLVFSKYGTYTTMFTVHGEREREDMLYDVTVTVMHLYNTSRVIYGYISAKHYLGKPAWEIEAAVSLPRIYDLRKMYVKCNKGDLCINGLRLAHPCELSDCGVRTYYEDFSQL